MEQTKPTRSKTFNMRLDPSEAEMLQQQARMSGFKSVSGYLRELVRKDATSKDIPPKSSEGRRRAAPPRVFHQTDLGRMYHGDSLGLFGDVVGDHSVDLVITSPPFGLVKKKEYGNVPADEYTDWFRPFAEAVHRALKPNGSFVIDIGPAWRAGTPTKSLYQFELLLMLCEEYGFHLAQDFYWWNP